MFTEERIIMLICGIPALVAGLTLHEFAHAWSADKLGDDTPRREGRLTLDPLAHLDLWGAIFYVLSSLAGFGFGWAKPVMTNPRNLKHPHRDGMWIALAGPISNILQTPVWMAAIVAFGFLSAKLGTDTQTMQSMGYFISLALVSGVVINLLLAVFNMVPIPPLDGHWVLGALAGQSVRDFFDQIRPYSFIILILLINFTPIFRTILGPVHSFALDLSLDCLQFGARLA